MLEDHATGRGRTMKKFLAVIAALSIACAASAGDKADIKEEVRAAVEGFNASYENNEVAAYFDYYADDATVFFYGERQDMAAYRVQWDAMMEAGGGVEVNKMSDLIIQILAKDIAVTTAFIHNKTRSPEGEVEEINAFETDVWRKIDGEWKVVSLHYTVIE